MHEPFTQNDEAVVRQQLERMGVEKSLIEQLSQKEACDLLYALTIARASCPDKEGHDPNERNDFS